MVSSYVLPLNVVKGGHAESGAGEMNTPQKRVNSSDTPQTNDAETAGTKSLIPAYLQTGE